MVFNNQTNEINGNSFFSNDIAKDHYEFYYPVLASVSCTPVENVNGYNHSEKQSSYNKNKHTFDIILLGIYLRKYFRVDANIFPTMCNHFPYKFSHGFVFIYTETWETECPKNGRFIKIHASQYCSVI